MTHEFSIGAWKAETSSLAYGDNEQRANDDNSATHDEQIRFIGPSFKKPDTNFPWS